MMMMMMMMMMVVVVAVAAAGVVVAMTTTMDSWDLNNYLWKSNKQDILMSISQISMAVFSSITQFVTTVMNTCT
jgi:hypothetical protein